MVWDSSTVQEDDHIEENEELRKMVQILDQKVEKILSLLQRDGDKCKVCGSSCPPKSVQMSQFKRMRKPSQLVAFELKLNDGVYKEQLIKFIDSKFQNMEKYSKSYRLFGYAIIDTFCSRKLFAQKATRRKEKISHCRKKLFSLILFLN